LRGVGGLGGFGGGGFGGLEGSTCQLLPVLAAARERNIPVTNTPGILTDEVADLAIGLMLASARQIPFADRYVRDGSWAKKGPIPLGRSVGGKTMGVLGLGGIGRAMAARSARAADDADDRVRQRRFIELPKRGRIV
jgi:D-isomer specific 2-hydroxyacid dehydrogenase, NAD binding domain